MALLTVRRRGGGARKDQIDVQPSEADADRVEAHLSDTVTVPEAEAAKPKHIKVSA
ncbi:hypothetical protein AB0392_04450 [Nonomuraea angiospora]|uniref:hypothetical protein n=1 Tax=Nonomuraea angiospora TaxID=46172 RepID=UPI00344EB633